MSLDSGLSSLIQRIYLAGDDGRSWESIGDEILTQTGACAGMRTAVDLSSGELADFCFFGGESSRIANAFLEYPEIKAIDPTLLSAIENPKAGFCASDAALQGQEYLSNDFVKWNRARFGATHWYVCYSPAGVGLSHSLSIHIPASQGAGTDDQIAKMRLLFTHMDSAAWLHRQPREWDEGGIWLLLDRSGKVTTTSKGADELLTEEDGLRLCRGSLETFNPAAQSALERSMASVAAGFKTGAGPAALWVDRPNGHRAWLLTVRPLTTRYAGLARVLSGFHVHLVEPRPSPSSQTKLTHLFDLSRREAEVLDLLARGHSLDSLATTLGISVNTAKVHLQAIFAKTRTRRQAELLQLCTQIGGS